MSDGRGTEKTCDSWEAYGKARGHERGRDEAIGVGSVTRPPNILSIKPLNQYEAINFDLPIDTLDTDVKGDPMRRRPETQGRFPRNEYVNTSTAGVEPINLNLNINIFETPAEPTTAQRSSNASNVLYIKARESERLAKAFKALQIRRSAQLSIQNSNRELLLRENPRNLAQKHTYKALTQSPTIIEGNNIPSEDEMATAVEVARLKLKMAKQKQRYMGMMNPALTTVVSNTAQDRHNEPHTIIIKVQKEEKVPKFDGQPDSVEPYCAALTTALAMMKGKRLQGPRRRTPQQTQHWDGNQCEQDVVQHSPRARHAQDPQ